MLQTFLLALAFVAICVLLLGVRIFFFNAKFPHFHISGNKEMIKKGIGCVESQDAEARKRNPMAVNERD